MNDDSAWYESLGPWLGESDALGALLAVEFAGGVLRFPAWQFGPDGQPLPGLGQVLDALRPGFGAPASQAGWLAGRAFVGEDLKRWEWLAAGNIDEVVEWASQDSSRVTAR